MNVNVIERAYQLARESGSVDEVVRKLSHEGYLNAHGHLSGRQIRQEIVARLDPERVASRLARRRGSAVRGQLGPGIRP